MISKALDSLDTEEERESLYIDVVSPVVSQFVCLYNIMVDLQYKSTQINLKQKLKTIRTKALATVGLFLALYELYALRLSFIESGTYAEMAVDNVILYKLTGMVMNGFDKINDAIEKKADTHKVPDLLNQTPIESSKFTKSISLIDQKMTDEITIYELQNNKTVRELMVKYNEYKTKGKRVSNIMEV